MYVYGLLRRPIIYYINILNILSQVFLTLKFCLCWFVLPSESFYKFLFSQINSSCFAVSSSAVRFRKIKANSRIYKISITWVKP